MQSIGGERQARKTASGWGLASADLRCHRVASAQGLARGRGGRRVVLRGPVRCEDQQAPTPSGPF